MHGQSGASRHGAFTGYDAAQFGILVGECLQGLTRVRRAPHGHHHRPCGHIRGWLKLTHNAETHTHTRMSTMHMHDMNPDPIKRIHSSVTYEGFSHT